MISECKDSNFPYKRRIINKKECLFDNEESLKDIFRIVNQAIKNFNHRLSEVPLQLRVRTFEAVTLLQEIVIALSDEFSENCKFAKYKRFVLRLNGYQFLIKKLDKNNMPMNIKTKNCTFINNQVMGSLFNDDPDYHNAVEPLLYIGYKKSKFGVIGDLSVVYIDENKLQWTISEKDLNVTNNIESDQYEQSNVRIQPKVKQNKDSQRRAN